MNQQTPFEQFKIISRAVLLLVALTLVSACSGVLPGDEPSAKSDVVSGDPSVSELAEPLTSTPDVVFSLAEDASGWRGDNTISAETGAQIQGSANLLSVGRGTTRFRHNSLGPVDVRTMRDLTFWYYIDDVSKIRTDRDAQVEIGSDNAIDTQELNWSIHGLNLRNGWNFVRLALSAGRAENINLAAVRRIRLYHFVSGEVTTRIDDIRFSNRTSSYTIELPNRMSPQMVTLHARHSLDVRADAQVRRGPRGFGRVVNTNAQGTTTFGARSRVGETWSACSVSLGNDADAGGTVYSPGPVKQGIGSDLLGGAETVPTLPDMTTHTWQPNPPERTGGDKTVSSGTTTLNPEGYGNVRVNAGGTIRLVGGVYHVGDLTVASGGKLVIDDSAGPVYIYVDGAVNFDGTVVNNSGVADDNLEVVIVVRGGGVVRFGGPFSGTVYAPESPVSLLSPGNPGYHGTYFGNDLVLGPGVIVWHVSFPWSGALPNAPKRWDVSTIHLDASVTNATGQTRPEEKTLANPVNFTIPAVLPVRNGNAGTGTARLKFRLGSEPIVTCTYRGSAGVAHPTTLLARMKGMIYDFSSCSDGSVVGRGRLVDWVSLEVVNGDAQDASKQTEVSIDSEDGCSAYVPPPLHPWEVVDLKSKFAWRTEKALPETDPSGRPALWHGLIYIENREQLAALDRLRIFWSTRPLSATYTEQMRGLCGRVEHATDGTGVVVYLSLIHI